MPQMQVSVLGYPSAGQVGRLIGPRARSAQNGLGFLTVEPAASGGKMPASQRLSCAASLPKLSVPNDLLPWVATRVERSEREWVRPGSNRCLGNQSPAGCHYPTHPQTRA
jgi:hypothetical protein